MVNCRPLRNTFFLISVGESLLNLGAELPPRNPSVGVATHYCKR